MLLFATIIFGLIANLIVIFLTNNFKLKTVVDQYVRNLAIAGNFSGIIFYTVSDAFLMLTCIGNAFERYNNGSWPFGRYGCKLFTYFSFVFMYASRFSVVLLAFDRFIAVSAPLKTVKYRTQRYAQRLCTILWSVCIVTRIGQLILTILCCVKVVIYR